MIKIKIGSNNLIVNHRIFKIKFDNGGERTYIMNRENKGIFFYDVYNGKEKLGFTLIMVTHNQNIADMARTIIRVNSGKITEVVTNDQPQTAYEIGW